MQISCADPLPTIHDFAGFGDQLKTLHYPARGFSAAQRAEIQLGCARLGV
ncbi:hypothetical protein [Oligoflexus tunisiensis]|nr:hypothetical protein [Oligoflexus tunisiensis]